MSLFGGSDVKTTRPTARCLKLEDPRIVARFIHAYSNSILELDLIQRADSPLNSVRGPLSIDQQEEMEVLDRLCTDAMLDAEKSCRKLRLGNIPWTSQLTQAQRLLTYHRLCFKKSKGRHISTKTTIPPPIEEARKNLSQAIASYRRINRTSTQANRATYLESLAVARSKTGDTDAETELQNLIRTEDQSYIKQAHNVTHHGRLGHPVRYHFRRASPKFPLGKGRNARSTNFRLRSLPIFHFSCEPL
jgi:hypothetical protein